MRWSQSPLIPAKAGIQSRLSWRKDLDPRFRGDERSFAAPFPWQA